MNDCSLVLVGFGSCGETDCPHVHDDDPREAFGYTQGLHERHGLSELLIRASSPGVLLPGEDTAAALGLLAKRYVERLVGPGGTVEWWLGPDERGTDDGEVIVFRFGQPTAPDLVEAFLVHPEATVIPVAWAVEFSEEER